MKDAFRAWVCVEPLFHLGHQALARICAGKPQAGDHKLVEDALYNAVAAGAPTGIPGVECSKLWEWFNNPNKGVSIGECKTLLATWDSWCEEKEDGEITLSVLKPFDFKKVPKRIEIRDGRTVWKEIKW